jgi:hypothetical protein
MVLRKVGVHKAQMLASAITLYPSGLCFEVAHAICRRVSGS